MHGTTVHSDNRISAHHTHHKKQKKSMATFKTAGRGTIVTVSDESMERASTILNTSSTSSATTSKLIQDVATVKFSPFPSFDHKSDVNMVSFCTAGRGTIVSVSDNAYSNACSLLSCISDGVESTINASHCVSSSSSRENNGSLKERPSSSPRAIPSQPDCCVLTSRRRTRALGKENLYQEESPEFVFPLNDKNSSWQELVEMSPLQGRKLHNNPYINGGTAASVNDECDIPSISGAPNKRLCHRHDYNFTQAWNRGDMTNNEEIALFHGVNRCVLRITSENATCVVFDPQSGYVSDIGQPWQQTEVDRITNSLSLLGCDQSKFTSKWIINHARWIIWKLAALERKFSAYLTGQCLTYQELLRHLQRRYNLEIVEGRRSALRKILNKDVASTSMMILCVASISCTAAPESRMYIELTDGWYSLVGFPDSELCARIGSQTITVGTKLLISNAFMMADSEGVDPLDPSFEAIQCSSRFHLRLQANATRMARWDTKLGFVPPSQSLLHQRGRLLVRSLRDILAGGGTIPLVDLTIQETFPLLYLENRVPSPEGKIPLNSSGCRLLTESEILAQEEKEVISDEILDVCIQVCEVLVFQGIWGCFIEFDY
jgi:breast cancer 2 susceptibility protein